MHLVHYICCILDTDNETVYTVPEMTFKGHSRSQGHLLDCAPPNDIDWQSKSFPVFFSENKGSLLITSLIKSRWSTDDLEWPWRSFWILSAFIVCILNIQHAIYAVNDNGLTSYWTLLILLSYSIDSTVIHVWCWARPVREFFYPPYVSMAGY